MSVILNEDLHPKIITATKILRWITASKLEDVIEVDQLFEHSEEAEKKDVIGMVDETGFEIDLNKMDSNKTYLVN